MQEKKPIGQDNEIEKRVKKDIEEGRWPFSVSEEEMRNDLARSKKEKKSSA